MLRKMKKPIPTFEIKLIFLSHLTLVQFKMIGLELVDLTICIKVVALQTWYSIPRTRHHTAVETRQLWKRISIVSLFDPIQILDTYQYIHCIQYRLSFKLLVAISTFDKKQFNTSQLQS